MHEEGQQVTTRERRVLGASGQEVSTLGVGVWAWGDRGYWGYGTGYTVKDLKEAYRVSLDAGITLFDTAEIYGKGRSERLLGRCMKWDSRPVFCASKFAPLPYRLTGRALLAALDASLQRLDRDHIDLYQIHWPYTLLRIEKLMDMLALAVEQGKIRAVGVSNYTVAQMERAHRQLAVHGIPLASNQVHYSLLHRKPENNGVLEACRRLNVALIAYSPLEQGILTGKYTDQQLPLASSSRRTRKLAKKSGKPEVERLIQTLKRIGDTRGVTPGQVALNWLICKDALVIPIPGAKTGKQAQQNAGALGWRLEPAELEEIERAAP